MSGSDRDVRERDAFAALAERAGTDAPVDAERVWDAVEGRLAPGEVAALLDVAAESPAVAEAWRLAHELRAEARREALVSARRPRSRVSWLAAAAAVLLALLSSLPLRDAMDTGPPVFRAPEAAALRALVEDGAVLPREAVALRWEPAPGDGWRYALRVTTQDLRAVLSVRDLEAPEHTVPISALASCGSGCASGERLYWRVEALHPDGRRRASETSSITLR